MSYQARREYLILMRSRYQKAWNKEAKTQLLNELCAVCGYNRSYATRLMRTPQWRGLKKRGRKRKYPDTLYPFIRELWFWMEQVSASRMKKMLPLWLKYYSCTADGLPCNDNHKTLLKRMSASTLGRFLKKIAKVKGLRSTRPNHALKSQIPIEIMDYRISKPGAMQADTVVHANGSLSGSYAHTLTMTDLFSGWTENRAIWTKDSKQVRDQIKNIEKTLPFTLFWFASDCGSEFLNYRVLQHLRSRKRPIKVTRSRPYYKDDNAYVEQKNWTHVRQLFGYDRISDRSLIDLMNEIYQDYWNPLHNYFFASFKLKEKIRVGAKIKKRYHSPKTPAQRLLESKDVTETQKKKLKQSLKSLNPFELKSEMENKLKLFFQRLRQKQKRSVSGRKAA